MKKGTSECHSEPSRSLNDTRLSGRSAYSADGGASGDNSMKNSRNDYADLYGFKIRSDAPVVISYVRSNSLAAVRSRSVNYTYMYLRFTPGQMIEIGKRHFYITMIIIEPNHKTFPSLQLGGLKEGDYIVEVAGVDVKWYTERQVNKMIRGNASYLELKVVTPLEMLTSASAVRDNLQSTISSKTSESQSEKGTKKKGTDHHRFSSWNLFRRSQSLGKLF